MFENIIGTLNPNANKFLVLACHYDSKYFPNQRFIGATDSAVPCSMMLYLIHVMGPYLMEIRNMNELSLKLVFFDGEEAFSTWGPYDSLYGSRHLASKLANEPFMSTSDQLVSQLWRWRLLIVLDLIGAPNPKFPNLIENDDAFYNIFKFAEIQLGSLHLLEQFNPEKDSYFSGDYKNVSVDDDHLPFMKRGVPILHLISYPYPEVWHTSNDNLYALSNHTIENLNLLLRVTVSSILGIPKR